VFFKLIKVHLLVSKLYTKHKCYFCISQFGVYLLTVLEVSLIHNKSNAKIILLGL